jgi:ribonuclease G
MDYIFIDSVDGISKVGIVEEGRLVEYYIGEENKEKLVGNIYRARIENVLEGMEAAFVDIGEGKNAYLNVNDALNPDQIRSKNKYKINEVLKGGQEIIVQVVKEGQSNKGPKVTRRISIPGRYLVLTPFSNQINVSRKISGFKAVSRLKILGEKIIKDNMGLIFRTMAEEVDESLLIQEYNKLLDIYNRIQREINFLPCPKLLYRELELVYQIVRDSFNDKNHRIVVNNVHIYDKLLLLEDYFSYNLGEKIILDTNFSMENDPKLLADLNQAINRKVTLPSGGHIVIDETEALTAIDVNTGKYIGDYSFEETVLLTNMEAAEEILRQIRLRDIGGIIIVDFIDMKNENYITKVLSVLYTNLSKDRNKPNVAGMTNLGLVEITRKRIRSTLETRISTVCPTCKGSGRIQK